MGKEKKRMERYCDTVSYLGYRFPRGEAVEFSVRLYAPTISVNVRRTVKTRLKRNAGRNVRLLLMYVPLPVFNIGISTNVVQTFGASPAFLFRPLHADVLRVKILHIRVNAIYYACKAHLLPGRRGTLYSADCVP